MSSFISTLKYGLPFVSFMVLGSVLLREFTTIRYEVRRYKYQNTPLHSNPGEDEDDDNEMQENRTPIIESYDDFTALFENPEAKQKFSQVGKVNLSQDIVDKVDEAEIHKLQNMGQSDWQNIRGPRPWEDNSEFEQMLEKVKNKKK